MGRPRGGAAAAVGGSGGSDEKGRRASTRERKELMASYNEDSSGSEYSEGEVEEVVSDYKGDSVSEESLSEPESSGSEYGSKKKKAVSPKKPVKAKAVKKGRARTASPKKGGKKAAAPAAKKASPAKKATKAKTTKSSPAPSRSRPQRGAAVTKRPRYKDRGSDSEEEESMELSESDEVEELPQEESEEESLKLSDDSDAEANSRKRKAPGASPKGARGRKPKAAAENGKAEKKVDESEKVDEESKKTKEEATNGDAKVDGEKMEVEESKQEETDLKIVEEKETERDEAKDKEETEDAEDNVSLKSGASSKEGDSRKNPIVTDYSSFSFDCDKKSKAGEAWNFKISCWNVGGVRGWVKKGGMEYLEKEQPDIMCFQEAKVTEAAMPAELKDMKNYPHVYWSYSATGAHHGVGILSKVKPENVTLGLPTKDTDTDAEKKLKESFTKDGRLIAAEYDKFILVNAYVPNSGSSVKDDKRPKPYPAKVVNGERLEWDRLFREYVKELEARKPVIVTGDLNVAHAEVDLANPKTNTCTAGFTVEEREGLTKLLDEAKLIDTFRFLYPDQKDSYSFWSYRRDARSKNIGWRLDYFLLSPKLQDGLVESTMRSKVLGSDHCPLVLLLHV